MAFLTDEEFSSLSIERSVFHIVGPQHAHLVLLQEFDAKPHHDFFLGRLRSLTSGNRYTFLSDAMVRTKLARIGARPSMFQEESENLATAFDEGHRGSAAVGAFLIFSLRCSTGQIFAFLKFEDEKVLTYAIKRSGGKEKPRPELGEIERTFVQNRNALQKAALIRLSQGGDSVYVVDRQNPQRPAAYFEQFLGVKRIRSEAELTKKLVEVARDVVRKHRAVLPPGAMSGFSQRLYEASQSELPLDGDNVEAWFNTVIGPLPSDGPVMKDFRAALKREGMQGESFRLEKSAVPAPRNRKLETASGVRITFPIGLQASVVKIDKDKGEITIRDAITADDVELDSNTKTRG